LVCKVPLVILLWNPGGARIVFSPASGAWGAAQVRPTAFR